MPNRLCPSLGALPAKDPVIRRGGPGGTRAAGVAGAAAEPVVLSICGGLDSGLAAELRATLRAAIDEPLMILDLSEVGLIDFAGLGVLIGGIRGVHEHGGRAAIVASPGPVLDLLGKVGVTRIAPVFTQFDEAQANLGRGIRAPGGNEYDCAPARRDTHDQRSASV